MVLRKTKILNTTTRKSGVRYVLVYIEKSNCNVKYKIAQDWNIYVKKLFNRRSTNFYIKKYLQYELNDSIYLRLDSSVSWWIAMSTCWKDLM